ncbi:DUF3747 domain-containing protein [Microcystis elabens FACHB-917]|nr:DUF3747 domain-containing protein [Microcystis elabens FACHB-917]
MQRTYLALAGLALAGAGLPLVQPRLASASGLFQSIDVDAERFAVLARPVGDDDWTLLVLEQLTPQPACWQARPDGLIDPSLNRFDYTGVCSRYLDSNGYSLRVAEQDLGTSYRLRVQQVGSRLELQAISPGTSAILVVGRADIPLRDRDGFVALSLEPGWDLKRRTYEERTLSHIYFASPTPLEQLIASAGGSPTWRRPLAPGRPQPPALSPAGGRGEDGMAMGSSGRAIALPVIPYTGTGSGDSGGDSSGSGSEPDGF